MGWRATDRIRREQEFKTFRVARRCAIALIHVATADPFRAGRDADLVSRAIVAYRRADSVRAMAAIVAGHEENRSRKDCQCCRGCYRANCNRDGPYYRPSRDNDALARYASNE